MLPIFPRLRFFLSSQQTDMHRSFDGLSGIITYAQASRPGNGDAYLFINHRHDRIKMLVWDRTGFWLLNKRLEQGTFQIPPNPANQPAIELSYDILLMLLEGIDISSLKPRPRYQPQGDSRLT